MIDRQRLLSDLRTLLRIFEADLQSRSKYKELAEVSCDRKGVSRLGAYPIGDFLTLERLCPARQKREFWSLFFITGRSRPQTLGRFDFPSPTISLVFCIATVHGGRFFSTP
jgi:hypothetical protein